MTGLRENFRDLASRRLEIIGRELVERDPGVLDAGLGLGILDVDGSAGGILELPSGPPLFIFTI